MITCSAYGQKGTCILKGCLPCVPEIENGDTCFRGLYVKDICTAKQNIICLNNDKKLLDKPEFKILRLNYKRDQ